MQKATKYTKDVLSILGNYSAGDGPTKLGSGATTSRHQHDVLDEVLRPPHPFFNVGDDQSFFEKRYDPLVQEFYFKNIFAKENVEKHLPNYSIFDGSFSSVPPAFANKNEVDLSNY